MIEVVDPGFFSTVQDQGRAGFRKWGVPVSGAMDRASAVLANKILGNLEGDGVLEVTLKGPRLRFYQRVYFCLSGAKLSARLEGQDLEMNTPYLAREGEVLDMGRCLEGVRSYLAVQGGIQTELKLGSRSQYDPVTPKACIQKGDFLPINPSPEFLPAVWGLRRPEATKHERLAVLPGPEWAHLSTGIQNDLLQRTFHVAKENNRMAYQLEEHAARFERPMVTSVTLPGTVQLTSSGRLIVLMRDAQTTGGYARIFQLTEDAVDALAQRSTGDEIRFALRSTG